MKIQKEISFINVLGQIWMPPVKAGLEIRLSPGDIDRIRENDENGEVNRDSVDYWLSIHSGDFQYVVDFYANLEVDGETIEISWKEEENEMLFNDCMFPMDWED